MVSSGYSICSGSREYAFPLYSLQSTGRTVVRIRKCSPEYDFLVSSRKIPLPRWLRKSSWWETNIYMKNRLIYIRGNGLL